MAPAKLSDDEVSAVAEGVVYMYGVVPALDIVFPILLVLDHDGMGVRRVVGAHVSLGGRRGGSSPMAGRCVDAALPPTTTVLLTLADV